MAEQAFASVRPDFFPLVGGLDEETPPITTRPGSIIGSQNYDVAIHGGYRRIDGYERFDGRPRPSDATYTILTYSGSSTITVGSTITGATSGATGELIFSDTGKHIVALVTGTFVVGEAVASGASAGGTLTAVEADSAEDIDDHIAYRCLAAEAARANIDDVPGSGAILGVVMYNDVVYAFRGHTTGSQVRMYRHDASNGWTLLGPTWRSFWFNTGSTAAPEVGDTITQSGDTATVQKVEIFSGTFAGNNATGRIWHSAPSPSSFAVGTVTYTGGSIALVAEATYDPVGGGYSFDMEGVSGADPFDFRFDFAIGNITGSTDGQKLYIVGGNNPPMEFNGTVLADIVTGMPSGSYPTHVAVHKQHLFVSYGPSLQHSAINNPWSWTLLTGAAELNVTDTITGILSQQANEGASGALAVFSRNSTRMLYGSSSSDWQLAQSSPDTGAIEWTQKNIGVAMYLDDRGLMLMRSQQEFGNFEHSSVSRKTQQFFESRRGRATCSMVIPSKNQYRIFFDDGSCAAVTMDGRRILGIAQISYGIIPSCAWSSEQSNGTERLFVGATDGYVYEIERGTSFDGDDLIASLRLSFHHSRSPYSRKRYRVAIFEAKVAMRATLDIQASLSSDDTDPATQSSSQEVVYGGGGYYDVNAYYNQTFYDSAPYSRVRYKVDGTGRNIGFIISSVSSCEPSHVLTGVTIHFSPRRLER